VARRGRVAMAELLTRLGADVNAKDGRGETPLHVAARAGQMDLGEWLVRNGADLNAKNAEGQTPIATALECDRMDMVKSIWNAAFSKLEDLEKDTGTPVLSLLKEAFTGEEPHLGATVLEYIYPLNFEDLKLANADRVSEIEHKYVNDNYEDLVKYVKMLEKTKEQQSQHDFKRKIQEPLRSGGSPAEALVNGGRANVDDKRKRKKGIASTISQNTGN